MIVKPIAKRTLMEVWRERYIAAKKMGDAELINSYCCADVNCLGKEGVTRLEDCDNLLEKPECVDCWNRECDL